MPAVFIALSLFGVVFFGLQIVSDPEGWVTYTVGIAVCGFLGARNLMVVRSSQKAESGPSLLKIPDLETLNEALGNDRAILYKHSTRCPVSAAVLGEVLRFAEAYPDWRTYVLQVIEQRDLSDRVAERLGVPHESPQAFVLRQGRPIWHASHYDITTQSLSRHLN